MHTPCILKTNSMHNPCTIQEGPLYDIPPQNDSTVPTTVQREETQKRTYYTIVLLPRDQGWSVGERLPFVRVSDVGQAAVEATLSDFVVPEASAEAAGIVSASLQSKSRKDRYTILRLTR